MKESYFNLYLLGSIVLVLILVWIHPFPQGSDFYLGMGFGAICTLFKQSNNINSDKKEDTKI
jgi:hypothetical protein